MRPIKIKLAFFASYGKMRRRVFLSRAMSKKSRQGVES
jgi:hypothetical protein